MSFVEVKCYCSEIKKLNHIKSLLSRAKGNLSCASIVATELDNRYSQIMSACACTFDITEAPGLYTAMTTLNDEGKEIISDHISRLDTIISSIDSDISSKQSLDNIYHMPVTYTLVQSSGQGSH